LRVVEIYRLVLHEAHDEARLERVRRAIEGENVQRNPVVVAPLPPSQNGSSDGGRFFVLDGAHRVHALRGIGCRFALVQVVALPDRAEGWGHLVADATGLRENLEATPGIEFAADPDGPGVTGGRFLAEARLSGGERVFVSAAGEGGGAGALVRGLWALREAYPDGGRYRRVKPDESVGAGEAVISYRRFKPAELVAVAEGGAVLPAGVTRFVVGERVLGVRLPLELLRDGDLPGRNAELDALVRAAREADRVRYYGEPVVLFE
jgi:hypothetical protein